MQKYQCPACDRVIERDGASWCDDCDEPTRFLCDNCHRTSRKSHEISLFNHLTRRHYTEYWCEKCAHPQMYDTYSPFIRFLGRWWPFSMILE